MLDALLVIVKALFLVLFSLSLVPVLVWVERKGQLHFQLQAGKFHHHQRGTAAGQAPVPRRLQAQDAAIGVTIYE